MQTGFSAQRRWHVHDLVRFDRVASRDATPSSLGSSRRWASKMLELEHRGCHGLALGRCCAARRASGLRTRLARTRMTVRSCGVGVWRWALRRLVSREARHGGRLRGRCGRDGDDHHRGHWRSRPLLLRAMRRAIVRMSDVGGLARRPARLSDGRRPTARHNVGQPAARHRCIALEGEGAGLPMSPATAPLIISVAPAALTHRRRAA